MVLGLSSLKKSFLMFANMGCVSIDAAQTMGDTVAGGQKRCRETITWIEQIIW